MSDKDPESYKPDIADLLKAVNGASAAARNAWLGFIALMAYLAVTLAGIGHKDLLLDAPTLLPFVNVKIPLTSFFLFGPLVLLFAHFGLLIQHAMLFEKLIDFKEALKAQGLERHNKTETPSVYTEVHSYFFTQSIVGGAKKRRLALAFRFMTMLTLVIVPFALFFYFQLKFLPFHREDFTWAHRIYLLADLFLLWKIGDYLRHVRCEDVIVSPSPLRATLTRSYKYAKGRVRRGWDKGASSLNRGLAKRRIELRQWVRDRVSFSKLVLWERKTTGLQAAFQGLKKAVGGLFYSLWHFMRWGAGQLSLLRCIMGLIVVLSLFVATVPDGVIDERMNAFALKTGLVTRVPIYCNGDRYEGRRPRVVFSPTAWLFERKILEPNSKEISTVCGLTSWVNFSRNLDLTDVDLVKDTVAKNGEISHYLRRRNFRYASFDGADLKLSDFTGSDFYRASLNGTILDGVVFKGSKLQFASFEGTDLRNVNLSGLKFYGARFRGANLEGMKLSRSNLERVDFRDANLKRVNFVKTNLKKGDFGRANLKGAFLKGINLQGSIFQNATLNEVNFMKANLTGTFFQNSAAEEANFSDAVLNGANFSNAKLNGTNFSDADLTDVDFISADLTGATLDNAVLTGVDFKTTMLLGTKFSGTVLDGIDFKNKLLDGTDFSSAKLAGANFKNSWMRGSNLATAHLYGANLEGASLEGALLYWAGLAGASLRGAKLDGTYLRDAILQGTDLTNVNLNKSDLFETKIWASTLPKSTVAADLTKIIIEKPNNVDKGYVEDAIERLKKLVKILKDKKSPRFKTVNRSLKKLEAVHKKYFTDSPENEWEKQSPKDYAGWQKLKKNSINRNEENSKDVGAYLGKVGCNLNGGDDAYAAVGLIKHLVYLTANNEYSKVISTVFFEELKKCEAIFKNIPEETMKKFKKFIKDLDKKEQESN